MDYIHLAIQIHEVKFHQARDRTVVFDNQDAACHRLEPGPP